MLGERADDVDATLPIFCNVRRKRDQYKKKIGMRYQACNLSLASSIPWEVTRKGLLCNCERCLVLPVCAACVAVIQLG